MIKIKEDLAFFVELCDPDILANALFLYNPRIRPGNVVGVFPCMAAVNELNPLNLCL